MTANNGSATVSVLRNDGAGAFTVVLTYPVQSFPTAVALLDLAGDAAPDLVVTSSGNRTLAVLTNTSGTFGSPIEYPVRNFPRAITQIDADSDGRLDLVVPCQNADSVVVLLSRTPGPPLLEATRFSVGANPRALVAADLDGDGDLDLAVGAWGHDKVTLRRNNGNGVFTPFPRLSTAWARTPRRSWQPTSTGTGASTWLDGPAATPTPEVSILLAAGAPGQFSPQFLLLPGVVPDDLAVGDFDRDGDLDIAVCDKQASGAVTLLRNDGSGVFSVAASVTGVGDRPTAIVAEDFDRDGDLDLAVGNDSTVAGTIQILTNDGLGGFTLGALLPLDGTDRSPLSLTAADFDGDGAVDLVAAAFFVDRLHVYRNLGGGTFGAPVPITVPASLQFVTAADLNLDGKPDLAAVAGGLVALRGKGALDSEPLETWMAGVLSSVATIADFNGDGRPDSAVANDGSGDVSLLLSTTCAARRLDVTQQPLACGASPYDVIVEARDDGGNLAYCATGSVKPSIVPGTGEPGPTLARIFSKPTALRCRMASRRSRGRMR